MNEYFVIYKEWQGQRDSNPQPTDLESAALPIRAIPLEVLVL